MVRFWLMQAEAHPSYQVMKDVAAVEWLSFGAAVKRLSLPLEKLFLTNVGRHAVLRPRRPQTRMAKALTIKAGSGPKSSARRTRA